MTRRIMVALFVVAIGMLVVPAAASAFNVSGTKFEDQDADGVFDAGEPGVAGFTIYRDTDNDNTFDGLPTEVSTTTAANGTYTLTVPNSTTSTIREVPLAGWVCSFPTNAECENSVSGPPNSDKTNINFGNFRPATISGTKFEDLNANGVDDGAGEAGLENVRIYIDADADNTFDDGVEASTLTDASGNWTLTGVRPGTRIVREVEPAGYQCTAPATNDAGCEFAVTVASNATDNVGQNFGNTPLATIAGTKFHDLDADGIDDGAGEPGIENVRIYIDADDDNTFDDGVERSTLTDASGNWSFADLFAGTYVVREVAPSGFFCSAPSKSDPDCEFSVTVTGGQTDNTGQDFGNFQRASVSGTKFEDMDADGIDDGVDDPGLSNVRIYVDEDGDDAFDDGDEPSTLTDADGNWSFTGLDPGTYVVREVLPSGYECSAPSATFANCEFEVTLSSGDADTTGQDFGNFQRATISGNKFHDLDAGGSDDGGTDPRLPGVTIYADLDDSNTFDAGEPSAITDANGVYILTGLRPGTYTVREVEPDDFNCSAPSQDPLLCEYSVTVTSGQIDNSGQDFGNFTTASISGTKFDDLDADGTQDPGEPGLDGITVYLDADGDDTLDGGETSVVTSGGGNWSFTGLNPGTQTVREVLPPGSTCSTPGGGNFANCEFTDFLSSGESNTGNVFGNFATATFAGTKFDDLDGDGTRDGGEPGVSGVTIYLDTDGNNIPDAGEPSTTTDGSGNWAFPGLAPGPYTVREDPPAGTVCTAPSTTFANCEFNETLSSGENENTANDFGNAATVTFSGSKFDDADGDGVMDAGETGISGVTVYIDANGNNEFDVGEDSNVTDGSGNWSFPGMAPGTYTVREVPPAGTACTAPSATFANCEFTENLAPGANSGGHDFGNVAAASLSGTKFSDLDEDGTRDAGEPGLDGVTIYLDADNDNALDGDETTTTTSGGGNWSFTGLAPGTYTVREVLPAGTTCTTPGAGDFANCEFTETLVSGENDNTGQEFGNFVAPPDPGGGGGGGTGDQPATTRPPFCSGKPATIVGTAGADRIAGTPGADVIFAGGGADKVSGGGGNDTVCGVAGKDTLKGGAGNDKLIGGGGKDKLVGGAGKDLLSGGGAADTCSGGGGSDKGRSCSSERSIP